MAPSVWCMPSPKTSLPSARAGELTVGSLRNGAVLLHRPRRAAFGSVLRAWKVETLKAPSPETKRRSPAGTGEATKFSRALRAHSTFGAAGPGLPSAQPVRCGLPRYVAHSAAGELTTEAQRHREERTHRFLKVIVIACRPFFPLVSPSSLRLCLCASVVSLFWACGRR